MLGYNADGRAPRSPHGVEDESERVLTADQSCPYTDIIHAGVRRLWTHTIKLLLHQKYSCSTPGEEGNPCVGQHRY